MLTTQLLLRTEEIFNSEPHHKLTNRPSARCLNISLSQISIHRKKVVFKQGDVGLSSVPVRYLFIWYQTNCTPQRSASIRKNKSFSEAVITIWVSAT